MTTDLADEEFWLEIVLAPVENEHWALRLRPPAPKCTLFKDFLSINIKYFVEHAFLLEVLTFIWSPSGGRHDVVIWFYINIFRIHNQLKCHVILWYCCFLEKICWRQWLLWLLWQPVRGSLCCLMIGQDRSRDLNTGGWLVEAVVSCNISPCHVTPLWSAEDRYQGTLSWPGTGPRRHQTRGEYSVEMSQALKLCWNYREDRDMRYSIIFWISFRFSCKTFSPGLEPGKLSFSGHTWSLSSWHQTSWHHPCHAWHDSCMTTWHQHHTGLN